LARRLTPNQESLISTAEEDLYMAALTGYDYSSFAAGKAKALWRTRISCPSRGLVMDQTLKTMIVMATPFIGRETAQPVWTNASDKYVPNIKLGDPKLEEFIDEGKMPTVDQSEATGKTSK
jgi:hypothetical protein